MSAQHKPSDLLCPALTTEIEQVHKTFDNLLHFCLECDLTFRLFERRLFVLMAALGRALIALFLSARHLRLDLEPHLNDGQYRCGDRQAPRTLKTAYGEVRYERTHLIPRTQGSGFHPLDVVLGLTRDRLSPWVMQLVARLATRMSFAATRRICKSLLSWSPATETIEQVVLGLGREAAPFMEQLPAPTDDGEVLIIEEDGKCPPTATEAELQKRRGKRKKHASHCGCRGCQRHRGRAKRQARGSKKRRKKGDKSKNGKEVIVLVMYTLKPGPDGMLHGPFNKKVWASFTGRKAAALWARAEATKRGFGPDTTKTVQIIVDGARGLRDHMEELFPNAILTLDVWHVVERLWKLGRCFHKEGSDALKTCVKGWEKLVYEGRAEELVQRWQAMLEQVPLHGPGTKSKRKGLENQIGYFTPRLTMMRYDVWAREDLVIGSGQVEGAVRQIVGERLDCAGMRWRPEKAEALLHLRCIELNDDWEKFIDWVQNRYEERLRKRQKVRILTDQPLKLVRAA